MQDSDPLPTFDSALNDHFRGHVGRDFSVWAEKHAYPQARDIPANATKAWMGRQKLNYRGISERQSLTHLISGNVDQPFLEEIGKLEELERLELEWPMVAKDLTPLLALTKLTFLSIDTPRSISDFRPLLDLPALRTLIITDAKKMEDLSWLSRAHHLEVIGIEGGTWSAYNIPSLSPLAGLKSLRAFLGVSTELADKSLQPLADCPSLEYLRIACVAPKAQFEQLNAAKPDLICEWFRPGMWKTVKSV